MSTLEQKRAERKKKFQVQYGAEVAGRYKWTQSKEEVIITVPLPSGSKSKDLTCVIKSKNLKFGIKGKPLIIDGDLDQPVTVDECAWTIDDGNAEITLVKASTSAKWWKSVVIGDGPQVDPEKIEGSQYVDQSLLDRIAEKEALEEEEREKREQERLEAEKKADNTQQPTEQTNQ